jgi:hypothetical protein
MPFSNELRTVLVWSSANVLLKMHLSRKLAMRSNVNANAFAIPALHADPNAENLPKFVREFCASIELDGAL